ncbi:MAG TPA: sialate O-acetylesterase, partial [Sedimentisphaerales bacterium]|nr:sialate O-acetylesterase [Sedimentisphaerales bacterium]
DYEKELAQADNPDIRLYTVNQVTDNTPHKDCHGQWQQATSKSVGDFSAVAYFFAQKLQKELNVPVGIINCCWAGTSVQAWMSEDMLQSDADFEPTLERYKTDYADYQRLMVNRDKVLDDWKKECEKAKDLGKDQPEEPHWMPPYATGCYNAMIFPVSKYTIKGFIWYQGEGNTWGGYLYRKLFATMIQGWRDTWGMGDMPFYFVQLANFQACSSQEPFQSCWAELRESQLHVLKVVKNTGMVVAIDIGDPTNVHPINKKTVGQRLAFCALAKDYKKSISYSGPIYKTMKVKNDSIILKFDHIEKGLICKGDKVIGVAIAGEDKKFIQAEAQIVGDTVVVSSDKVLKPIAVRYGWQDAPLCNLYNSANLPASPFRTDSFPAITANNK